MLESKNVFQSALPYHFFSKLIGLGFYKFNVNGQKFEVHAYHKVSFIVSIILWIGIIAYNVLTLFGVYFDSEKVESKYLDKIDFFKMFFEMVFGLSVVIFHQSRISHIHKFLINLNNFDETLKELKWKFRIKNSWRYFLIVIASALFIIFTICFYHLPSLFDLLRLMALVAHQINAMIFTTVISQFTAGVMAVKTRFDVLFENVK